MMLELAAEAATQSEGISLQDVVSYITGAGFLGLAINFILGLRKDKVERGTLRVAEAAQDDTQQGKFRDQILERLAAVERRADERERAFEERERNRDLKEQALGQVIRVLWSDIDELEDHIRLQKPPPPPQGRRHELQM